MNKSSCNLSDLNRTPMSKFFPVSEVILALMNGLIFLSGNGFAADHRIDKARYPGKRIGLHQDFMCTEFLIAQEFPRMGGS